jgi:hypothetical protein
VFPDSAVAAPKTHRCNYSTNTTQTGLPAVIERLDYDERGQLRTRVKVMHALAKRLQRFFDCR